MEYVLTVLVVAIFVGALFWIVGKTFGRIPVVQNSPTLDDLVNPGASEAISRAEAEYARNAEHLSETVRGLADGGEKIAAVKAYMDESGVGLMEAKKTVEAYINKSE